MIYDYKSYKPNTIVKWVHKRKNQKYCEQFISLDTETSHNHDKDNLQGWIYQWAYKFNGDIITGRKPSELALSLKKLCDDVGATNENKLICYVHNLSYDFQYLKHYLVATLGDCKRFLAINTHRILSVEFEQIIFKCSYILSNRSLDKWAKDLGCVHKKRIGLVDYSIIRTQQDELTDNDWIYQIEDIEVLEECIIKQLELYGDTISTIPLTSTGYVRRTARHNSEKDTKNRQQFQKIALNEITYNMCRLAFSGGLTHGNRFLADTVIEGNIRHRDFTSHYPTQQICYDFPIGKFGLEYRGCTLEELKEVMEKYCCLIEFSFSGAVLKDKSITFPYLQESKCKQGKVVLTQHIIADNGRVLKIEGYTILYVTELDMKWLLKQYNFTDFKVGEVYIAKKGKLPQFMRDTVNQFFYSKSHFKILAKQEKDPMKKLEYDLSLMKSKNGLNGIYGMSATDIIRDTITMDFDTGEWDIIKNTNTTKALESYYKGRNSFLSYQWGVWTTARARDELMSFIELVGYDKAIYCDTDSLFYISTPEIEKRISEANMLLQKECERQGYYVEVDGKRVFYNHFGDENEEINKFKFLHAKCYAYEVKGELHCAIAGVSPRKMIACENNTPIYYTREQELGDINNLAYGKVFSICGGVLCSYVEDKPHIYNYKGLPQETSSSCVLLDNTKTLKNHNDYIESDIIYQFSMTGEN